MSIFCVDRCMQTVVDGPCNTRSRICRSSIVDVSRGCSQTTRCSSTALASSPTLFVFDSNITRYASFGSSSRVFCFVCMMLC